MGKHLFLGILTLSMLLACSSSPEETEDTSAPATTDQEPAIAEKAGTVEKMIESAEAANAKLPARRGEDYTSTTIYLKHRTASEVRDTICRRNPSEEASIDVIEGKNAIVVEGPLASVVRVRDVLVPQLDVPRRQFVWEFVTFRVSDTAPATAQNAVRQALAARKPITPQTLNGWKSAGTIDVFMAPKAATLLGIEGAVSIQRSNSSAMVYVHKITFNAVPAGSGEELDCSFRVQQVSENGPSTDWGKMLRLIPGKNYHYVGVVPFGDPSPTGVQPVYYLLTQVEEIKQ